jgi:hypothetical protein
MGKTRDLREGLAANLRTVSGLQVSPYVLANPTPPSADILPAGIDYYGAMQKGVKTYLFNVQVIVTAGLDEAAQMALDDFVDSDAIPDAIESDETLGGACDDVIVHALDEYGRTALDGKEYFVARWQVEVLV